MISAASFLFTLFDLLRRGGSHAGDPAEKRDLREFVEIRLANRRPIL